MECEALPEGCIANILSHTTPVNACRLSLVSKIFCSAAHSNDICDHFLPSDFMSIISRSNSKTSLLVNSPSKKSLYLALSHHPIIIDDATKYLEESSTKNVCLDPNLEERQLHNSLQLPDVRSDGWLEIEIGEFFNSGLEDDEVQMRVMETDGLKWNSGLFIEGIEV